MDMVKFERILEQIIIPRYKELVGVSVTTMGLDDSWFKIVYSFTPPLDKSNAITIMEETTSLYKMLGVRGGDIIVSFEPYEG